ncbi:hypothetical protein C8J57DRAFT_364296 [Mycena rebaudengoi]|nr:hypothetical protein C8J57DRAFT_364296 [Mycena rebaudengoi]
MNSPFKDILNTNTVPSDAECQSINDLLKNPRKQCADFNAQISRMQKSLDDLMRDRDELQSFIDAHLALVSPARRLPDDVIREIFVAALPSRNCIMSATEPPLLLCKICRPWRALALSTPQLWASVHIAVPSSSRMEKMTTMVDNWLSRSGVLPLSLSVVVSNTAEPDIDVSTLLNSLIHFSSRWKKFSLTLPSLLSFSPLSKVSPEHLSMLEHVCVKRQTFHGEPVHSGFEVWRSIFAFIGAPNLRNAFLNPQLAQCLSLPWGQLRHLNLSNDTSAYIASHTALAILRQCVGLESCVLAVNFDAEIEAPPPEPCRMEHLQYLSLETSGEESLSPFCENLQLPNLRFLEYCDFGDVRLRFLPILSTAHLVESLSIQSRPSITDLVEALRLMPMLLDLRLEDGPVRILAGQGWPVDYGHDELVALLTPGADADGPVLSPQLRRIVLRNVQALSEDALLKFLQARTSPHLRDIAHLSTVRVQFLRRMEVDIFPPLHERLAAGLEVTLDYEPDPRMYSPSEGLEAHSAEFANTRPVEW